MRDEDAAAGAEAGEPVPGLATSELEVTTAVSALKVVPRAEKIANDAPREGHVSFRENQRGISYDRLFGPYLVCATNIEITDPCVRNFNQVRNVMELMETILRHRDYSVEAVRVHLTTGKDEYGATSKQVQYLQRVADVVEPLGIDFPVTWT